VQDGRTAGRSGEHAAKGLIPGKEIATKKWQNAASLLTILDSYSGKSPMTQCDAGKFTHQFICI
jgi:hypothetical protein